MGNLGWPEIMVILVIALIVFGPRKLPELGKTLGQSLAQFRKASDDFKRQWEDEVEVEKRRLNSTPSTPEPLHDPGPATVEPWHDTPAISAQADDAAATVAPVTVSRSEPPVHEQKRDWM